MPRLPAARGILWRQRMTTVGSGPRPRSPSTPLVDFRKCAGAHPLAMLSQVSHMRCSWGRICAQLQILPSSPLCSAMSRQSPVTSIFSDRARSAAKDLETEIIRTSQGIDLILCQTDVCCSSLPLLSERYHTHTIAHKGRGNSKSRPLSQP